jgi:hypothetical protein
VLLDHMCTPTGASPAGEHRHKRRGRQAKGLQDESGVELDVRLKVAPGLHVVKHPQRCLLDLAAISRDSFSASERVGRWPVHSRWAASSNVTFPASCLSS